MQDNSYMYNLSNPALNNDLGLAFLDKTIPNPVNSFYTPGITGSMSNVNMQGHLKEDKFEPTRQQKDSKNRKKLFAIVGLGIAGIFAFKGGKKVFNVIKNVFNKIKTKIKK